MNATQTEIKSADAEYNEETVSYKCPRCDLKYDHEILVRTHIHRSKDKKHLNWNGFMPETEIEIVNEDGEVIGISSKSEREINERDLQLEHIPDEYSDKHKCIILAGAYHYDNDDYTTTDNTGLESAANGILKENGFDTLSYSTVRRVLREFYRPQEVEAEKKRKEKQKRKKRGEETLTDLTPKQQGIIIRKLVKPNEPNKQLGEHIGKVAPSYPKQVYEERAPETYNRLKQRIEDGMSVKKALLTELTDEDIAELNSHGFNIGIDLDASTGNETRETTKQNQNQTEGEGEDVFDMSVGEQRKAMSATPFKSASDSSNDSTWETTETADTSTSTAEQGQAKSGAEKREEPVPVSDKVKAAQTTDTSPAQGETAQSKQALNDQSVSRENVKALYDKIEWFIDIEAGGQTNGPNRQLAFAEKMHEEIGKLLGK